MTRILESLLAQQRNCRRGDGDCRHHCRRCKRARQATRD